MTHTVSLPPKTQEELAAYTAILHTMSIYHINLDQGDFQAFGGAFTENGIFETTSGIRLVGRSNICETFAHRREERSKDFAPGSIFQRHHLTSRLIEMAGPHSATAYSYVMLMSEVGLDHFGTYHDKFQKIGDRWLISHRKSQVDWISPKSRFQSAIGVKSDADSA